jgi:polyphosphate glucokinase
MTETTLSPAPAVRRRVTRGIGLGIDIGGSGIKGAPVDLGAGQLKAERVRIDTPQPSTPDAVADVVAHIVTGFGRAAGTRAVGVTFPAVIQHGVARTAANVDKAWVDTDVDALLTKRLGRSVFVVNDADAAGLAEARYGAAKGVRGLVFMATLGTGIGTALIHDGILVPNSELGHIELDGKDAETQAAASVRENEALKWEDYIPRLQRYFGAVEQYLWPDLIVVGGGISKKADKFLPHLKLRTPIVAAGLRNDGGIVGAAILAAEHG